VLPATLAPTALFVLVRFDVLPDLTQTRRSRRLVGVFRRAWAQ
jgi:hypothetical protein